MQGGSEGIQLPTGPADRNDGDEPAVSIHAYSPRLEEMTFYRVVDGVPVADYTVRTDQPEL